MLQRGLVQEGGIYNVTTGSGTGAEAEARDAALRLHDVAHLHRITVEEVAGLHPPIARGQGPGPQDSGVPIGSLRVPALLRRDDNAWTTLPIDVHRLPSAVEELLVALDLLYRTVGGTPDLPRPVG